MELEIAHPKDEAQFAVPLANDGHSAEPFVPWVWFRWTDQFRVHDSHHATLDDETHDNLDNQQENRLGTFFRWYLPTAGRRLIELGSSEPRMYLVAETGRHLSFDAEQQKSGEAFGVQHARLVAVAQPFTRFRIKVQVTVGVRNQ